MNETKAESKHLFPFLCRLSAEAIVLPSGFNAVFSKLVNEYFKGMFFFYICQKIKCFNNKNERKKRFGSVAVAGPS